MYFRVVDGTIGRGDYIKLMNTGKEYEVDEVGVLAPKPVAVRRQVRARVLCCAEEGSLGCCG